MKNTKQIIILLLISLTLVACRYDEGPMISFRTVKSRVAQDFQLVEFTENNINMTQEFADSVGKVWKFLSVIRSQNLITYTSSNLPFYGYYEISTNKKNITIYFLGSYNQGHYVGIPPLKEVDVVTTWEIERLTKEEMWLSCTYYNSDYYLKLKANEN
jgi:hypothetical protein